MESQVESKVESKNKRRIGGFDIFIIIVIIAGIVGGGYYYLSSRNTSKAMLTYELEFTEVPDYVVSSVVVGDKLRDGADTYDLGTITAVLSNTIMKSVVPDADKGAFKETTSPENKRVVVVKVEVPYSIKGGGSKNIENLNLGGTLDIKVGKPLIIKAPSYIVKSFIIAIDSY